MRVLVTGAGGFIGQRVVRQLASTEHDVLAVVRTPSSGMANTGRNHKVSTVTADLGAIDSLKSLLDVYRPEAVIHLAWYAEPHDYLVSKENSRALAMTNGLVEAALSSGCRKFVIAGTCAEYTPQDRLLQEEDATEPISFYGICKLAALRVSRSLIASAGGELAWARIFHLHGPGEDPRRLIPWVANELKENRLVELTDGRQVRDHLHVADVAAGLITLLDRRAVGVFNVCSGQPITLREVLETLGAIIGRPDLLCFGARPYRSDDPKFLAGDPRKLFALGWSPKFSLRDGLRDALTP